MNLASNTIVDVCKNRERPDKYCRGWERDGKAEGSLIPKSIKLFQISQNFIYIWIDMLRSVFGDIFFILESK